MAPPATSTAPSSKMAPTARSSAAIPSQPSAPRHRRPEARSIAAVLSAAPPQPPQQPQQAQQPQPTNPNQPTPKPAKTPHLTVQIPPPTMTTIRPFAMESRPGHATHRSGVETVFRTNRTLLNPRFLHEPTATIASYIYCQVYHVTRMPSFVLENGAGHIVGYISGAPSTPLFTRRIPYMTKWLLLGLEPEGILAPPNYLGLGMAEPSVDEGGDLGTYLLHMAVRRPNRLFGAHVLELWHKWPAHVQINILPEYQKQGWGRAMMEVMVGELVREGCRGMHLTVHAGNRGAEEFFKALGFERYQGVLDEGVSGEFGRTGGGNPMLYLVKQLW